MPYDLSAIEHGYGECDLVWKGHTILLRYRADVNNRSLLAMQRAVVGVLTLDGVRRFPDVETMLTEVAKRLLPSGPDVPEHERGWDLTRGGVPIPVTFDELVELDAGLPAAIISAIAVDIADPNRRRPSSPRLSLEGSSQPIASPTTTASSSEPSATDSIPTGSPIPIGSIQRPEPASLPTSNEHAVGFAGLSGTPS